VNSAIKFRVPEERVNFLTNSTARAFGEVNLSLVVKIRSDLQQANIDRTEDTSSFKKNFTTIF
jgi:hypothetical protein